MKRLCFVTAIFMILGAFVGCTGTSEDKSGVELSVVTPFCESDGNRSNFVNAYKAYEKATGNTIIDVETESVDEKWKLNVLEQFKNGNEPDVIYFFTGADADELIQANKFVSMSEIRSEFPEYASNMKESLMPVSTFDGRQYAVAVYGYWEGLFVNNKVLDSCGIVMPETNYTWDQFLRDCQTIKDNGYTPIACSLAQIPHYWFEYCLFNNGSVTSHNQLPQTMDDKIAENWVRGLNDIKELYDRGFFPDNTNEANNDTTTDMILNDKAAFLLEGSWKVGWFQERSKSMGIDINNFAVTYVPSNGSRKTTDAVGGFSMGYCITRSAWENPEKRKACVEFVMAMTTDEVTSTFGALTVTALKNGVILPNEELDKLAISTIEMTKGCTAMVPAAQDSLRTTARDYLFSNISPFVKGEITAKQLVEECLKMMRK